MKSFSSIRINEAKILSDNIRKELINPLKKMMKDHD